MFRSTRHWIALLAAMASLLAMRATVRADEPGGYDGLQAGADAYQSAEAERLRRIDDQLYLNDALRARYGWPLSSGRVVLYGNAAGYQPAVGIDYAYAYSSGRLRGRRGNRLYFERYWSPPVSVFEPWPYIPGDIYGDNFPPVVRQPIGQRQFQSGTTRWESHPVYAEELAPAIPVVEERAPQQIIPAEEDRPAKKPRRRAF